MNAEGKICKTVHQYNSKPISPENMEKLMEIAADYQKVKNYVYARFGGIGGLSKIYPGYTVQNEMTASGLRNALGMPSVYFYLAVFDALGDMKSQWTQTKGKVLELIGKNEHFSPEEKHYLRFLIRVNDAFDAVLNQRELKLPDEIQKKHDMLAVPIDQVKIRRYLCRQVRKYHRSPHTDKADGFSLSERAYRYGEHGIYISMKEKRQRLFVPLTDNNRYKRQIYLKLYPESNNVEIKAPVDVAVKHHEEYVNSVAVAMGIHTMLTTQDGHCYGEQLGEYQSRYGEWMRRQTGSYNQNRQDNPGRKKYCAQKRRMTEQLHSYINHELNRFIAAEKAETIYIVKLPKPGGRRKGPAINNFVTMWQRGYIRKRLEQKCGEQSINIVEVLGKDISVQCSECKALGSRQGGLFFCSQCGYTVKEKINTARNILRRGMNGETVNS